MDTELTASSIFNDPALLMFMQTLEQVTQQQQSQNSLSSAGQANQQGQQQQQQLQSQQTNASSAATLEQILQQVSILQAFQELANQQNAGNVLDSMMIQEDDQEEEAVSDQNTVQQHLQHQANNQFASSKRSHSPAINSLQTFNSQQNYSNNSSKEEQKYMQNSHILQVGDSKFEKQNNGIKNTILSSPSLTSVNLSLNQENNQQNLLQLQQQTSQKGRAKKDTSCSTIRIKQASASSQIIDAPPTPSQLPIIPEIIVPSATSNINLKNTINNSNFNQSNSDQSNNLNLDLESFNLGNNMNNSSNTNGGVSDEMQLLSLLSSCLPVEQIVQLALSSTSGNSNQDSNQTAAAAAAALAMLLSNNHSNNSNNNNQLFTDSLHTNNDSGDENNQNQVYSKYSHLMNTPTSSNMYNSNNKTAINTSNGTQKTQQSKILSGASSANHQNSNTNFFQNITTNLSSFFEANGLNSGEKKAQSPSYSRQTTTFIPHIISHNNQGNSSSQQQQQQQLPAQQLNFSQIGSIFNQIDPTTLSFQALMAQHNGIDTPEAIRLREQKRLERQLKIERYKNKRRNWIRKISYDCRKRVADSRLRIKGRFISKKDSEKLKEKGDDSCQQNENTMALEQPSQNESHKQDYADNNEQKQYFEENINLYQQEMIQQQQNGHQNPEIIEYEEANNTAQKGFDIQNVASQSNIENNQNPTEEINNANICELTCAAAMNPASIQNLMKPEIMDRVKQRILNKKPLFSLISSEPNRFIQEIQNQSSSSTTSSSTTTSTTSTKNAPINTENIKSSSSKMNLDQHNSLKTEQKMIEA
ncbi:hypothetical protein ABPG74_017118 [Tetrahymena malaccensis]